MDLEKERLFLDFLEENGSQLPTKKNHLLQSSINIYRESSVKLFYRALQIFSILIYLYQSPSRNFTIRNSHFMWNGATDISRLQAAEENL